jgi:hypothetical protein
MAIQPTPSIRESLLMLVNEMETKRKGGNLQQSTLLNEAAERMTVGHGNRDLEQAILTQWQDLFRTGLLAWGSDLMNPNPPNFHVTETGRRALANATRDPSNPAGYLRHLDERATITTLTRSYLVEGLDCYVAGLYKAAAVMVGAAAESVILELRNWVVDRLGDQGQPVPKDLNSWQVRTVTTALADVFEAGIDKKKNRDLWERYDAYWSAFTGQIRFVRNEAGHPISIDPVTAETVHASLLVFPELATLAQGLLEWVGIE